MKTQNPCKNVPQRTDEALNIFFTASDSKLYVLCDSSKMQCSSTKSEWIGCKGALALREDLSFP